jgi:hypothetical protein
MGLPLRTHFIPKSSARGGLGMTGKSLVQDKIFYLGPHWYIKMRSKGESGAKWLLGKMQKSIFCVTQLYQQLKKI